MSNIFVFGSLNMDLTIETDRIPAAGETMMGRGFFTNAGGKGANQAAAAARMAVDDVRVSMVGAAGKDVFGPQLIETLESVGVDCSQVERIDGISTGVASIIRTDGDNRIILDPGANHALRAQDVAAALDALRAQPGDIFLAQLECDFEATIAALEQAHARGLYAAFNPAPAQPLPDDAWDSIDLLCLNETECELLSGILPTDDESTTSALNALAKKGVQTIALTLGGRGSVVYTNEQQAGCASPRILRSTPPEHEVVDTTCAGDTYLGALLARLAAGAPIEEALEWATCASALATTKLGAQQSIPSRDEVATLVASRA